MPKKNYAMRYVAGQPVERVFHGHSIPPHSYLAAEQEFLADRLRIMVWNIFKQQRADWLPILRRFSNDVQLMLLQEAQATPQLVSFATTYYQSADQVPALLLPKHPAGVMTLSSSHPVYCCPLKAKEPLLRLAKSALITVYPINNGQKLMVVNIHAVNFSLGVNVYRKQLGPIGDQIMHHNGPVIMAGDLNAWSKKRLRELYRFTDALELEEVQFTYDNRRTAFGRPLDFVFYRHLNVSEAAVLVTQASDHNPLLVEFQAQG